MGKFLAWEPNLAEPASPGSSSTKLKICNQSSQKLLFRVWTASAFSTCPSPNPARANKRPCKYLHFVPTPNPSPRSYSSCPQTHAFTPDLIKVAQSEPGEPSFCSFDPVLSSPSSSLLSSLSAMVGRVNQLVSCSFKSTPQGGFLLD